MCPLAFSLELCKKLVEQLIRLDVLSVLKIFHSKIFQIYYKYPNIIHCLYSANAVLFQNINKIIPNMFFCNYSAYGYSKCRLIEFLLLEDL